MEPILSDLMPEFRGKKNKRVFPLILYVLDVLGGFHTTAFKVLNRTSSFTAYSIHFAAWIWNKSYD